VRCLPGVDDPPVTDRALPSWCGHGTGGAENGAGRWAEQRGGGPPYKRTDTRRARGRFSEGSLLAAFFSSSFSSLALLLRRGLLLFRLPRWLLWRHGRETRQRRWCGGPARRGEECRRGFADHERSRGQARPRRRSWERENSTDPQGSRDSFIFFGVFGVNDCGWRLSPVR